MPPGSPEPHFPTPGEFWEIYATINSADGLTLAGWWSPAAAGGWMGPGREEKREVGKLVEIIRPNSLFLTGMDLLRIP